ncbi:endoplasmic reticulum mannosyl-oligosaccharide 1,2-alpha-mannosidase [Magnaporthiopsis poae ATCC 64411]|uniref:alpha-1,2-Mannosidase n=1 Tax=Magnaporthiopsis poae (strain ATCC 64411 / 73-15) TaxID=644358 RepID=A0A0C4DTJ8_MAGP6|nr:endoplasmic reticulum mannosyl-oligosaccharide 1,2-alpha-mannosidase [Magnaporthiopsis poae ATCC 64411]
MSFAVPKHVPSSFGNPQQRELEDRLWAASRAKQQHQHNQRHGGVLGGVQDRVGGFFDPGRRASLPMYKDKPYAYPPSHRNRPIYRTKRGAGFLFLAVLGLFYLSGAFDGHREKVTKPLRDWSWPAKGDKATTAAGGKVDWSERRARVVDAFELSWAAYERYAWGYDEFYPVSKKGRQMAKSGLGWIIVDSLDTMMLMNLTTQLKHARQWITKSLTYDQDQDVNTFETTIRMVGGLLSAHYLSTEFPDMAPLAEDDPGTPGEDLYLEKAKDLADRLLSAFETPSGIPLASVNLAKFKGIASHADGGASSTAEATTLQLEFKYLAKLTGEKLFWDKAEKVMEVVDGLNQWDGLVPIFLNPATGKFQGENIRLGSRGDSYYEYLIKQYLQTNKKEQVYSDMWHEALGGVRKHLVTYTEPSGFTIIGERPDGLERPLSPKMDWKEDFIAYTPDHLPNHWRRPRPYFFRPSSFAPRHAARPWRKDFIVKEFDSHNLQRPETVESLFYMWRITGDTKYRDWGWEMFSSFMEHTAVPDAGGFTSLSNANKVPPVTRDNMESFWLAETLKYFYLLFSPNDLLPLDRIVINTEAHPLPRFDMGPLFSTGWKRKPREKSGSGSSSTKDAKDAKGAH